MKRQSSVIPAAALAVLASVAPAGAQDAPRFKSADVRQTHYQIGVMERVLEGAVEHGAALIRDRLQAIAPDAPAQMLILDNPRVRGFRLDSYGVFFDVEVPSLNGTLTWSLRTLDQNDLGLQSALNVLKSHVNADGDVGLQQALKRIELQVGPATLAGQTVPVAPGSRNATGGAASLAEAQAGVPAQPTDPILDNPNAFTSDPLRSEFARALLKAPPPPRSEPAPYRQWGENLEPDAVMQMEKACLLPISVAGALMPDAHPGYGLPIGGVLATAIA